jgi:integrase
VREELIGRNVAQLVETPSRGSFEVEPLSEADARKFLKAATDHWLYALWLVLITTGLRKGEVLGLAWSDIDLESGAFKVRRTVQRVRGRLLFGKTKTKKSTRTLYLGRVCLAALAKHRKETSKRMNSSLNLAPDQPADLIFVTSSGRVVEPRNVNTMLRRLLRRAGLEAARVHDLRHTAATLLLMDGATIREVMEQLGHTSISTTANVYGHVLDEAKRRMATRMDKLADLE